LQASQEGPGKDSFANLLLLRKRGFGPAFFVALCLRVYYELKIPSSKPQEMHSPRWFENLKLKIHANTRQGRNDWRGSSQAQGKDEKGKVDSRFDALDDQAQGLWRRNLNHSYGAILQGEDRAPALALPPTCAHFSPPHCCSLTFGSYPN
jgi:hypothetical protein